MKPSRKKKLVHLVLLIIAVIAVTEFQKFLKRRVEPCEDGICRVPAEKVGALVGPQSVPMLATESSAEKKLLPQLIHFDQKNTTSWNLMEAVLTEISLETSGKLRIRLLDVVENAELAEQYSITSTPALIFLDTEGTVLSRRKGIATVKQLLETWAGLPGAADKAAGQ